MTGTFSGMGLLRAGNSAKANGVFYVASISTQHDAGGDSTQTQAIGFNANRSNGIYGASSTVQSPSAQALIIIKT